MLTPLATLTKKSWTGNPLDLFFESVRLKLTRSVSEGEWPHGSCEIDVDGAFALADASGWW